MEFSHIKTRTDIFESRYFDFQRSHKYLVYLDDQTKIETAAYEHFLNNVPTHIAIDISTMAGCPMKCAFCASSSVKFWRYLHVDEIIDQVKFLISKFASPKFSQITCSFQGVGEPSVLPEQIIKSSKALLELDERVALSLSTICASQTGLYKIVDSGLPFDNLQLTLCGTTDDVIKSITPAAIMPDKVAFVVRKLNQCENLKKIKVNYLLMNGVNDNEADLRYLIRTFRGSGVIVKISSLNETASSKTKGLVSSTKEVAKSFSKRLIENSIDSYVFGPFCNIEVGCGQLIALEEK